MSKTVKQVMIRNYQERLDGRSDGALISMRGIDAISTTRIRSRLREKDIRVTVVRNDLARQAFEGTNLSALDPVLVGSSAIAYGAESAVDIARELVEILKEFPDLELKGAVLDGQLFEGEAGVKELSKFPTREEAVAQCVTLLLSPFRSAMGAVSGPARSAVACVKAVESRLEDGEEIKKVG